MQLQTPAFLGHSRTFYNQKRQGSDNKQRLFPSRGEKNSPPTQINKPIRRTGRRPEPLGVGLHLQKKAQIPPGDGRPSFFLLFWKEAWLSGFDSERECIQKHLRRGWEAAHIPGKFSGRKSLWKRVGVYSTVSEPFQSHE